MPKIHLKEFIFGGKTFCCCLPVRFGVITMSLLGVLFGGLLSILLWFEVANSSGMSSTERTAFILAGLVETLLLVASVLGFVGAVVRKQTFIQAYAYFTYVHFLLNVGVAGYFLYVITHVSSTAVTDACDNTIKDHQAQSQCTGLLQTSRNVFIVVALVVLLIELYGALILARYVNQIQSEKRTTRSTRMAMLDQAGRSSNPNEARYVVLSEGQTEVVSPGSSLIKTREFDPYEDMSHPRGPSHEYSPVSREYDAVPAFGEGYGGGFWSHEEIEREEKLKLQEMDQTEEMGMGSDTKASVPVNMDGQSRRDAKSPAPPPPREVDPIPRYDSFPHSSLNTSMP